MKADLLVVDDDADIRSVLAERMAARGHRVREVGDGEAALEDIGNNAPDLVLLDLGLPKLDGFGVLEALAAQENPPLVIVLTALGTVEKAVAAMRAGAFDFLTKPFAPGHVDVAVERALEHLRLREEVRQLRDASGLDRPLIGSSERLRELATVAQRAAASNSTVLLLGESGTGKEVLARAIHGWSPRAKGPFVAVNCVALSEELLESELFGHERGAFTGAHQRKLGKFELANGGTIFLDEIGDIRGALQAKLLRVLQEHEIERVGGNTSIPVDIRVLAATNRNLDERVASGAFREDLYYRLNVVRLELPPLREHPEDIPELAEHFLRQAARECGKTIEGIDDEALQRLQAHRWPGNVRELENAIERAVVLGTSATLRASDLPAPRPTPASRNELAPFHESVENYKRELIQRALLEAKGSRTRAAELLDLQRTYLSRLIGQLGLRDED